LQKNHSWISKHLSANIGSTQTQEALVLKKENEALQKTVENLKNENAELKRKLEEGNKKT
jgi:hypothetical protein